MFDYGSIYLNVYFKIRAYCLQIYALQMNYTSREQKTLGIFLLKE